MIISRGSAGPLGSTLGGGALCLDVADEHQKHARPALASVRAGCLFSMSRGHLAANETGEAERRLREALALLEQRWGSDSPRLLAPCVELARLTHKLARPDESKAFLERAEALPDLKPAQRSALAKLRRSLNV